MIVNECSQVKYCVVIDIGAQLLMIKEFKQFLFRGNVVDLAVGVVIGGAF